MKRSPWLLVLLLACGGSQAGDPASPAGPGSPAAPAGAKPAAAGDVSIELDRIPVAGLLFEPAALNRPGMPLVEPKRKTTLAAQRQIVSNARDPVLRQAQAAVLATMLYQESKTAEKAKEKELLTEARQALRDAASSAGKDVDEVTLRLLGSYELLLDDYPAAEKAWQDLVNKDPKDKDSAYHRAWWVHALLRQWKNAEALAVASAEPLTDKQPELAYVAAWAKWRSGDDLGAWQAIVTAAKGWGTNAGREDIDREVLLIAGRSRAPYPQVIPELFAALGAKQPQQQYDVLAKLGLQAYQFAGRWSEGISSLEEALKLLGPQTPPADRPVLRYTQADYTVRLDTPDVAARYAKQALEALAQCPKCPEKDKQDLVNAVAIMGRLFHIYYATANDKRFYQPAYDLYTASAPLLADAARKKQVTDDTATLERTLANTKVGTGTHSKDAINVLIGRHNQEIQACYEAALVASPKLAGTLTLMLDSDQTGAIKGVASDPKAGQSELAAVAACAAARAKKWHFPKRGMTGTTRVKVVYGLSPAPPR
jgi:tetratricopeptide (TPR) repeat protein